MIFEGERGVVLAVYRGFAFGVWGVRAEVVLDALDGCVVGISTRKAGEFLRPFFGGGLVVRGPKKQSKGVGMVGVFVQKLSEMLLGFGPLAVLDEVVDALGVDIGVVVGMLKGGPVMLGRFFVVGLCLVVAGLKEEAFCIPSVLL